MSALEEMSRDELITLVADRDAGIAARDVTPEAVRGIMRVELPGYGEAMRMKSFETLPNAILSRSLGAVVEQSLVMGIALVVLFIGALAESEREQQRRERFELI